jgi:hypothetical protein
MKVNAKVAKQQVLGMDASRKLPPLAPFDRGELKKEKVSEVPGAIRLQNLFSKAECRELIKATEAFGYKGL